MQLGWLFHSNQLYKNLQKHWSVGKTVFVFLYPNIQRSKTTSVKHTGQSTHYQRTSGPVKVHLTPGPGIYFNAFIHVYSPRAGADPLGTKFWCQQKSLVTLPICCKFKKKKSLKSDFIHNFSCLCIHVYSPEAGADHTLGSEFLCKHIPHVTLVICCKFLPLNDFLPDFFLLKHKGPNLTLP